MKSFRSRLILGVGALLLLPVAIAVAEKRAIRHAAYSCYGTSTLHYDLYPGTAPKHDWGVVSRYAPAGSSLEGSTLFCPVTLDVPMTAGTPINKIRIVYSTREADIPVTWGTGKFTPDIKSCSVYLMDGSDTGSWYGETPEGTTAGPNTGSLFTDGEITIEGATVALGGPNLRRMLVTCQLPRAVSIGGVTTGTAMVKGYEVQYTTSTTTTVDGGTL
jgi:hypothetical protein